MAQYDLPALFNFVLAKTQVKSVIYIGHSQGTMQMFAALSENLDFFRDKINLCIMLAPATKVMYSVIKDSKFAKYFVDSKSAQDFANRLVGHEVMPEPFTQSQSGSRAKSMVGYETFMRNRLANERPELMSQKALDTLFGHYPAGSSFKSGQHFIQNLKRQQFAKFDHGKARNLQLYGLEEPPLYDLKSIKGIKFAIFNGSAD